MEKPLDLSAALNGASLQTDGCGVCAAETIKELKQGVRSIVMPTCAERKHEQAKDGKPCLLQGCKVTDPHSHIATAEQRDTLAKLSKPASHGKPTSHVCQDASCGAHSFGAVFKRLLVDDEPAPAQAQAAPEKPVAAKSPAPKSRAAAQPASAAVLTALESFAFARSVEPPTPKLMHSHTCGPACGHSAPIQPSSSPRSTHVHSGDCCGHSVATSSNRALSPSLRANTNTQTLNPQLDSKAQPPQNINPQAEQTHEHHQPNPDTWRGISAYIEKSQMQPQLQKAAYLISSIAAATPFGELFAGFGLPEIANKLLSPLLGVSAMQGIMHGKDRLTKFFWTLPIVGLSSLASLANIPRLIRRVVTVALLQAVEFMRDPKLHKHGDHFHGDTEPRLKYLAQRFKDKSQQKHFLQSLAKLEVTINSSIPLANLTRSQVEKRIDNKIFKRAAGWTSWLVTLVASIMGLDFVGDKIITALNKRSGDQANQDLVAREAALACGSCGGMHVEAACPTVIAEESALAAVA